MTARVVILQETLPHYRVDLLRLVREEAALRGIEVEVVHGRARGRRGRRLSTGALPDAVAIRNRYLRVPGTHGEIVWQPALRRCLGADLVVVEQANRLVVNYLLLAAQHLGGPKVVFWGHGRNLQASMRSAAERFKRRVARLPRWWLVYTAGGAEHLASIGYPTARVTVIGNTLDVVGLRKAVEHQRSIDPSVHPFRCVHLGGLHRHKRLDLLFGAADLIARRVPDFELCIAGTGEQADDVERFVRDRPWAHALGHVEGDARAALLASARLLLNPGLLGLVVLDSFAAGVPLVSTIDALHSPEVEYVEDGVNGVLVREGADAQEYAEAVVALLRDDSRWRQLREGAWRSADRHGIEPAAQRFADGLAAALEMPGARVGR